ncbi:hypothetical protein [Actinomadura monticuli]|uniref:Uncharacterized protein n=1 Tax=Actinomadura monticuli TaxID=3097367 RepID=A0ABV4QJC7_9ACTN
MTMRRMLVMAGGAVVPLALISILLGNQWVVDAINDTGLHWDEGIAPPLYWLLFPAWRLSPGHLAWKYVVVLDIGVVLFFVLLILLAVAGARAVDPQRGAIGAVVTGWWATVVAGGIAGFVLGVMMRWALDITSDSGPLIFNAAARGASFGFAYGWLAGLGMLLGYILGRPRGAAAQPGPYAQRPGMPVQQPAYGQPMPQQPMPQQPMQPMQQPAPYVPQPQQPWGGMPQQPVPQQYPQQQAAPQQFGAAQPAPQPPVPQQPPAPQAPAETPEAPAEAGQDAAEDDAREPDDLDLGDRTVVDRKRDGDT